jgi:hypothetical protein
VTIRDEASGRSQTFRATSSGSVGHYEASIVFPESGTWKIVVDDGLAATGYGISRRTTFGAVDVAPSSGSAGDGADVPLVPVAVGALALLVLTAAGAFWLRRLPVTVATPTGNAVAACGVEQVGGGPAAGGRSARGTRTAW